MAAKKLEPTTTPGIFRRHRKGCPRGRCDCAYVVVWRHRGKQHTATYRTVAEAREAKGNRDAGDRRPIARVRFGDYFADWIESYSGRTARGFSETSRTEYRRILKLYAEPVWGTWRLADVEPADVRGLLSSAAQGGASASELRKLRAALSAMFETAIEDGSLRSNPARGARIPVTGEEPDERAKALSRSELAILLAALPAEWRLFFEFLAQTGLRISEAVGLTWAHVDLGETPRVLVREQFYKGERKRLKTGSGRRDIPLSRGMASQLLAHRRDTYRGDEAPVFARHGGRELYPQNVSRQVLDSAAESVGLGWVSYHSFRHTCASLLFDAGRNVKQVAEWLGHADPGFTLRTYIHLLDAGLGEGLDLEQELPELAPA
jgi:integrase